MALFAFVDVDSLTSNYMCIGGDGSRGGGPIIICIDELWQLTKILHASRTCLDKIYIKVSRKNFLVLEWKPFFSCNFFSFFLFFYFLCSSWQRWNYQQKGFNSNYKIEIGTFTL